MKLKIPHIFREQELIDKAFAAAREAKEIKIDPKRRIDSVRDREIQRINTVAQTIIDNFSKILTNTFKTDELTPFYYDMISLLIDMDQFKKSMAAILWAKTRTQKLASHHRRKIKVTALKELADVRRDFYGREASVVKQIKKDLLFLGEVRRDLRALPDIKDEPSIVLTGFPNVGKSSLLKKLTGANPEIKSYPFTTKGIMVGYLEKRAQILDTPGLLDRPEKLRNNIELRAISAIKNISNIIVFVFDVSEIAYPKEKQLELFDEIKNNFDVKIFACMNKSDAAKKDTIDYLEKNIDCPVYFTSTITGAGIEEFKKVLLDNIESNMSSFKQKKNLSN
ncbi:GTP-binding protein [archaeon]|nr:GTP-binding protein [archaeon]